MEIELITVEDLRKLKQEILHEIRTLLAEPNNLIRPKKWLKSRDVQKILSISPGTLQTMRNRRLIPFTRIGGVIFYNEEEVRKELEKQSLKSNLIQGRF
ncbi:helix-turn-helix domain-containing protein [Algoriphagus confluentis]|uniref:Helix-turn-helix domain-containing protein n=1 Tax=Algoriphagus confluentis TaxID=1697556 RepID=A0ABQ6PU54_9BACT|nr:helix-turn-helix domain-containing protein [Algoriphagus confluentis]